MRFLIAGALALHVVLGAVPAAHAQSNDAMTRIQRHGRMSRTAARALARTVHERMVQNAARGGDRYDPLRQALGRVLFGGPGATRAEYDARLAQVLARLGQGLTEENLTALFPEGSALRCAGLFGINMTDCDALIAAAARSDAELSYLPPDDGAALAQELTGAGASREVAAEIVRALGETSRSLPASLDASPRGRRLAAVLRECPGGLDELEAQVRAWHLGATSELARCVGVAFGRERQHAPGSLTAALGMRESATVAFLRWSHGQPLRAAPARAPTRDELVAEAAAHYRANRFADAARAYERAVALDPSFMPAVQGLAGSRMRAGDARGAAEAYRAAARIDPRAVAIHVGLARALAASGEREGAIGAYRMALSLEPGRADAQRELAALRPPPERAPPPARPATPPRGPSLADARAHFDAGRFIEAERIYRQLAQNSPNDVASLVGLGDSLRALGLAPEAAAAYERALAIDPAHAGAREGLARVQAPAEQPGRVVGSAVRPPEPRPRTGPTLMEVPSRDDIVRTLAPYASRLAQCSPTIDAVVTFRIRIGGADGAVQEVEALAPVAGTPAASCMESHLLAAQFPRFSRDNFEIRYPFRLRGPQAGQAADAGAR